jgi:hypothetical protein
MSLWILDNKMAHTKMINGDILYFFIFFLKVSHKENEINDDLF